MPLSPQTGKSDGQHPELQQTELDGQHPEPQQTELNGQHVPPPGQQTGASGGQLPPPQASSSCAKAGPRGLSQRSPPAAVATRILSDWRRDTAVASALVNSSKLVGFISIFSFHSA